MDRNKAPKNNRSNQEGTDMNLSFRAIAHFPCDDIADPVAEIKITTFSGRNLGRVLNPSGTPKLFPNMAAGQAAAFMMKISLLTDENLRGVRAAYARKN